MRVIIVGAGFGGLGCAIACRRQGFEVIVVDLVEKWLPLGDSIGFGANSSRLLKRWGVLEEMLPISSKAKIGTIHNYDGEVLGTDDSQGKAEAMFGYPSLIGHRGDFHTVLLDFATRQGAKIRTGCKVVRYDNDKPSVFLESGEEVEGDIVIASDGVKSEGRTQVLGLEDAPIHSGYAVWRSFADATPLKGDPIAGHLVDNGR